MERPTNESADLPAPPDLRVVVRFLLATPLILAVRPQ